MKRKECGGGRGEVRGQPREEPISRPRSRPGRLGMRRWGGGVGGGGGRGGGCSNRAAADGDVFVEGDVSIVTVTKSRSYSSTADASAADPVKVLC